MHFVFHFVCYVLFAELLFCDGKQKRHRAESGGPLRNFLGAKRNTMWKQVGRTSIWQVLARRAGPQAAAHSLRVPHDFTSKTLELGIALSTTNGSHRSFYGSGGFGDRVPSNFTRNQHRMNLPVNIGFHIVPEQQAFVVERLGKFSAVLYSGFNLLIPVLDRIRYVHSLKEQTLDIPNQNAITKDNVAVTINGILYVRVVDPYKASYGVEDPLYAVLQLAQTSMRSELGKITLDKTFEERETLNSKIVNVINEASNAWGMECLRYEIRDITPPQGVRAAMELQAEAERRKRAKVLESEADKQSAINVAEGEKEKIILASEAAMQETINRARGEAESIQEISQATAVGVERVAQATKVSGSNEAIRFRIAESYIQAFSKLAKETNTVLLPSDLSNPSAMLAQAMTVFTQLKDKDQTTLTSSSANVEEEEEESAMAPTKEKSKEVDQKESGSVEQKELPPFSLQKP